MKAVLRFGVVLFALFVLALFYTVAKGYTTVYVIKPAGTVRVDGRAVRAYIHRSKRGTIVTRRDTQPPHSYLIASPEGGREHLPLSDCGSWVAPRSPVLLINHQNPVCSSSWLDEPPATPDSPMGAAEVKPDHIEFTTRRGEVVSIVQ